MSVVLFVVTLVVVIADADLLFLRNRFWERLLFNVGVVLVFAVLYLRFFKEP